MRNSELPMRRDSQRRRLHRVPWLPRPGDHPGWKPARRPDSGT